MRTTLPPLPIMYMDFKLILQRACKLPCAEDCVMTSEYGPWSSCDRCWTQNRTRVRTLLRLPSNGGENCTGVTQTQPCGYREHCGHGEINYHLYLHSVSIASKGEDQTTSHIYPTSIHMHLINYPQKLYQYSRCELRY